jgi:hypothetical protein
MRNEYSNLNINLSETFNMQFDFGLLRNCLQEVFDRTKY